MRKYFHIVLILVLAWSVTQNEAKSLLRPNAIKASPFLQRHVFLTVNALATKGTDGFLTDRRLELNWQNFDDFKNEDWIGLFGSNPAFDANKVASPIQKFPITSKSGVNVTTTRLGVITEKDVRTKAGEENCVGFWVGYFRKVNGKEELLASNCLRVYPSWMNDLKATVQNVPLNSLMIPGTHDAGAWQHYDGSIASENVVAKYTYTQEETIYNQLLCGIRYLDVRPAYYPNTEEVFWVNHGAVKIYPMIDLLTDVKNFVTKYNEVVFMDFHEFPVGFTNITVHQKLFDFVNKEMGSYLAPKSLGRDVTLAHLWSAKKSVIFTYNNDEFNKQHDVLWPYLIHAWGDKNKVSDLEQYLEGAMGTYGCKRQFWSAMTEITPKTEDILGKPTYGLRGFAQDVNIPATYWFQRPNWYSKANVISTDYFLGNNIIEMSVIGNQNRISCPDN